MKFNITIFAILFCLTNLEAQPGTEQTQTTHDALNGMGSLFGVNKVGSTSEIIGIGGSIIGTQLLDSIFRQATIKLFKPIGLPGSESDSIKAIPIRYDFYNNYFEVMVKGTYDIRGMDGRLVRNFTIYNRPEKTNKVFINVSQYKSEEALTGFMELITKGKVSLLEQTKLSVVKPTFNAALNSGSKDTKIYKTPIYFYLKEDTLFRLPNSRKKIIEAFNDKAIELGNWLKEQDIDYKNKLDLARLIQYYNSL
jgi:hypothetical protein